MIIDQSIAQRSSPPRCTLELFSLWTRILGGNSVMVVIKLGQLWHAYFCHFKFECKFSTLPKTINIFTNSRGEHRQVIATENCQDPRKRKKKKADILTKALPCPKHHQDTYEMGLVDLRGSVQRQNDSVGIQSIVTVTCKGLWPWDEKFVNTLRVPRAGPREPDPPNHPNMDKSFDMITGAATFVRDLLN